MGIQVVESPEFNINYETINNLKNLVPSYDKQFDTFFVSQAKPIPAVSVDWDGEFWIRVTSNGDIVGIEIENFEKVFLAKHPEVRATWKEFKRVCLKNEGKLRQKPEECESFLRILLNFLSDLFRTHPQQQALISA
jgi:uncharacterized protein YuzE